MNSNSTNSQDRTGGYLALSATSILWGTTWVASKIGVADMPALQIAYIRQFIAGACFVLFFMITQKLPFPNKKQLGWITLLSILMFVMANGLSTWSLKYIPTGLSALVGALYPLSVVILERVFFKSRGINTLTIIGLILGIGGTFIVFYENAFSSHPEGFWFGVALSVSAMLAWSVGTMVIVRNALQMNPYYATGWQMLISSFLLFIFAEVTRQEIPFKAISWKAWGAIGYLVIVGSLISFAAFIYSMKKLPAAISSLYAYINPLVAMLVAHWVLGEKLTINILWGALVTLLGVFMVNYSIKKYTAKQLKQVD
jgi:drug/metabolite transporter (DMT)-like permease